MSYKCFLNKGSQLSKEDREFYELKNRAAEYYRANGVPQKMEDVLNLMFYEKPDDVYGYLANYFSRFSTPPMIYRLLGKEVYDGKGEPTVQADVVCITKNEEKIVSSAVISSPDAVQDYSVQDASVFDDDAKRKDSVLTALQWINESLTTMLKGYEPADQAGVDKLLSDFFAARSLEEQDRKSREKEEQQLSESLPEATPPPMPPTASKDKKTSAKGKKNNHQEKPIPPAEPPEQVLPGSMAIGAVSLAVAKAAAHFKGIPLYQHIASLKHSQECPKEFHIPLPMVTLLSCGKSSPGKLNLMDEIILIPKPGQRFKQNFKILLELRSEMGRIMKCASKTGPVPNTISDSGALVVGYDRFEQPLDLITETVSSLGLTLGTDIHLAVNCAAHKLMDYQKGKYEVSIGTSKSPDEMVDMYVELTSRYPGVIALIDPLRKEDREQWDKLYTTIGHRCYLLAEFALKPICSHLNEDSLAMAGINGLVLKQTNHTTVCDLIEVTKQMEGKRYITVTGTTDGEPCDDALSDLAVGLGVRFVKLGGLRRGERVTKYSRLISIEEELAQQGILGSTEELEFNLPCEETRD
ncbi:enolase 4 isoform X1 [Lepisosteus oculatus]|uniref:enolase 4 isoform X1 n=2 Tax=Lepisosteus oculatus TaxID=7918 RepID=UPI003722A299